MKAGHLRIGPLASVPTVPGHQVRETRDQDMAQQKVEADPQEALLLYGRMLADVDILMGDLRGLMFDEKDYRSRLRVVRSAALRLAGRAATLLGEKVKS